MGHIKLKPTIQFEINFHPSELDDIIIPEESKEIARDYVKSKKLSENDIMIMMDNKIIYGYDYLYQNKKLILPEVNPVTIFYSNAIMSSGLLQNYKETLLSEASVVGKNGQMIDLNHSGAFFQLAINCIVNLQATLESFANVVIPHDYLFTDSLGNPIIPTISHKLNTSIPEIRNINFKTKFKRYCKHIDALIQLRNNIIHLKPVEQTTNTVYKNVYRQLLNFDYHKTIIVVSTFVNFYEPDLLSECGCGNDFSYDIIKK